MTTKNSPQQNSRYASEMILEDLEALSPEPKQEPSP
jgi:hypothetical protein